MEPQSEGGTAVPGLDPELGTRIEYLVSLVGSDVEAARVAGISVDTLSNYEKLRTGPKLEPLIRLARKAGVSISWVITGEGTPTALGVTPSNAQDYVALPRYDVVAAAGNGNMVVSEQIVDALYFKRDWLRQQLGIRPERLAVIAASGDSMAPTIENGDLLVVDVEERRWKSDGVYVIGVEDEVWVKRLARRLDGGIVVSSDNPLYAHTTQTIERADIRSLRLIGRVVWVGGRI